VILARKITTKLLSLLGLPFNPISGTSYKGINLILLMGRSWEDPRWMTYKQAQENLQTA
jgi:antirestriction protein ArdC